METLEVISLVVGIIAGAVLACWGATALADHFAAKEEKAFHGGTCIRCGAQLRLVSVTDSEVLHYSCDKCRRIVTLRHYKPYKEEGSK